MLRTSFAVVSNRLFCIFLLQHVKKKQRVKVMEFWIETARECFNIGNFNSLMAIIAGLNMSPISRLKKTVSPLRPAIYLSLDGLYLFLPPTTPAQPPA